MGILRDLPRVPVACAVVAFLSGILAALHGEGGEAVLCGVIAATFVEVAVLRREVRRARDDADRWEVEAWREAANANFWRNVADAETPPRIGRGY